jgi:holo-ACP synthase
VIDSDGRLLSRRELGLPAVQCLICQQDAHVCARGRAHSLDLLLMKLHEAIDSYERGRSDGTAYAS